jgi:DNA helicase-2/ATP-dependent DNA helicase PcrA
MAQMQQVAALAGSRRSETNEPLDPQSPYFGHLRLEEKGRGTRDVLIGRGTYIEPNEGIRIVDWRHAPVSQLYYRHGEGANYEEIFGDREVEGKVLIRRTLGISQGQLRRVTAPQGTFVRDGESWRRLDIKHTQLSGGEGSAVRAEHMKGVLGAAGGEEQREDRHLPEIAALLDARQFELISKPESGLVVVQGGAGSGKTTIGVHRMAYLAYQGKGRFAPDRMLVIVGTPALRAYIGQLLDALKLSAVRVLTFDDWARQTRARNFGWLRVPIEDHTPLEVSKLKTHPAMLDLLESHARKAPRSKDEPARAALDLWADVLTDEGAIKHAIKQHNKTLDPNDKRRPPLTDGQLDRALRYCRERCPAVVDWEPDELADAEGRTLAGADGISELIDDRAALDPEDDALLLRALQLTFGGLRGRRRGLSCEHLFVDEAQDLAPVDLAVLADIVTEPKSITLAGDTAQRINIDTGFDSWDEVLASLRIDHVEVEPLRIAYRSTQEVLVLARHVLGPLAPKEPPIATRSGAPVEYHAFSKQGAAAAFLGEALRPLFIREPRATVAVLARYPEQADAYYAALKMAEVPFLRRVENYDFAFKPGVEVTDIRQVKGLEYDYIVMVDVNASTYPINDDARYQLHIGATRAAHQLWLLSSGPPSPLLPASLVDKK